MLILPAIDIRDGRCVRLFQGDYSRETIYGDDPAEVAERFEAEGAAMLHVVDLDGARAGTPANLATLQRIARHVKIPLQFGGGIRSLAFANSALDAGASRVVAGSRLAEDENFAAAFFGELGERAVAGVDARDGRVAISGWTRTTALPASEFAVAMERLGAKRFVMTDVATDGTLAGPNLPFLGEMAARVSGRVIASGGISSLADLRNLAEAGIPNLEAVIVGKALYEGRFELAEALAAASASTGNSEQSPSRKARPL
jgi:phosphoribosylformimino-5-aminoimidazole carboxamide ribotide isomerase